MRGGRMLGGTAAHAPSIGRYSSSRGTMQWAAGKPWEQSEEDDNEEEADAEAANAACVTKFYFHYQTRYMISYIILIPSTM